MPHIGVTMERSLQNGGSWGTAFADLLSRSAAAALGRRQSIDGISNDISDAATAFSSWDNCFQASICKWPVIALFIVGGLIIFSIVWCIIRCCCCGLSCCCECCYCLKCCGQCCGLCDPPRGQRSKYLDEPFVPPNHDQAYRSQAPMHSGFEPAKPSMPSAPSVPQYAEFDTGNKKDADALPAMPSWEDASSKKVLIEEEYVEMEPLKKKDPLPNSSQMNVANMPSSTSPRAVSPYGPPAGTGGSNGYMAAGHNEASPYGMNQQGYNDYDNQGYGQQYPSNGMNNAAIGAAGVQVGRRTPHQDYNNGYDRNMNQGYNQYSQSRSPRPYQDEYGRSATPTSYNNGSYRGMAANDGYGNDRRSPAPQRGYLDAFGNPQMGSPGAQAGYGHASPRASPAPQAGYRAPQRSQTHDDYTQQYPAPSHQQYSNDPYNNYGRTEQDQYMQHPVPTSPTSPIRNNGGFDFNSGYARPDSRGSPSPAQNANGGSAYPGYRNYKPAQNTQPQQGWDRI